MQSMIHKWSLSKINFTHTFCLFCLLCTKLESVGHCLRGKQYYESFHSARNLEMESCIAWYSRSSSKTSWINSVMFTKIQQFGSFTWIVLIRKERPCLLVRCSQWLTMIRTSHPGPYESVWVSYQAGSA